MSEQKGFISLLQKILPLVHKISLAIAAFGLILMYLHMDGAMALLMIGMSTLAGVYFMSAQVPTPIPAGAQPSIYSIILYKVMCIGGAVCLIGILFQLLKLEGSTNMLLIGFSSTGLAALIGGILSIVNNDNWIVLKDTIVRSAGLVLICAYMLNQAHIF